MNENQRFAQYLRYKGIRQQEVANKFDVSRQYISAIISGRDSMSMNFVKKILDIFPDLNADWLLTGRGEMLINAKTMDYSNDNLKTIIHRLDLMEDKLSKYETKDKCQSAISKKKK